MSRSQVFKRDGIWYVVEPDGSVVKGAKSLREAYRHAEFATWWARNTAH